MDEQTLQEIAKAAVRRKRRWLPPTLDLDELLQEAIVGILEAQHASAVALESIELQVAAERHLVKIMRRESTRKEVPSIDL